MDHTCLLVCPVLLILWAFLFTSCVSLGFEDINTFHNQKSVDSVELDKQEFCYETTPGGCHRGPVIDELSSGEDALPARGQVGGAAGVTGGGIQWDERGYVTLCQRMGNFGNQMETFLGMLAFAKTLDRTLIIPHFTFISFLNGKTHQTVLFSELFQISPLLEYHRVVTMDVFLNKLAPKHWPPGQRKGYVFQTMTEDCNKASCWRDLNPPIEFDECFLHKLTSFQVDIADERSMSNTRKSWNKKFPVKEHPVISLSIATPAFPMNAGNRKIQKFVKWNEFFVKMGMSYINETFGNNTWVGLHLRNGEDWVKACTPNSLAKHTFIMASPQCHDKKLGAVSQDMCLPSVAHMLELTLKVVKDVNAKQLFIATDKHPHLEDFRNLLLPIGVSVHHLNPKTPQVDLVILGQADYFIGTCPSSFTSFVKRDRDANGRPSIFWGQEYIGF